MVQLAEPVDPALGQRQEHPNRVLGAARRDVPPPRALSDLGLEHVREFHAEENQDPHEKHRDEREQKQRERARDQVHAGEHRDVLAEHGPKQLEEARRDQAREAGRSPADVGVGQIAVEKRQDGELGGERKEGLGERRDEDGLEERKPAQQLDAGADRPDQEREREEREAVDRDPLEESPSLRRAPHRVERRFHDEDQSNRRHDQGHEADSGDGGRLGDELPQALGQLRRVVRQDAVDHLQDLVVLLFEESGEKQRKRREQGNGRQERSERERSREVRPAVGREAAKRVRDDLAHRHQDAEELLGHHRRACLCALDNHGDVPFRLSLVAIARFVHRPDHRLALTLARSPLLLRGGRPSNRASTG